MEDFASDLLAPKPAKQAPTAPVQQPRGINMGAVSDTAKMVPEYAAGGALGLVMRLLNEGVLSEGQCPSSKHLAQVWRGVNGERASSGVGF
jgi:hypothetical protein